MTCVTKVVGHEGYMRGPMTVSWATPVLQQGSFLINPTTGRKSDVSSLPELIGDRMITRLDKPIEIPDRYVNRSLLMIIINRKSEYSRYVIVDAGCFGGLIETSTTDERIYYVLTGRSAFDQYCERVITNIINVISDELPKLREQERVPEIRNQLLRLGLTLDCTHPIINALQVHFADNTTHAEALAMARLRNEEDIHRFRLMLQACSSTSESYYSLKYEHGVAEGGGMDINVLSTVLSQLLIVHKKIIPTLTQSFSFLKDCANRLTPRFHALVPASAEIQFSTTVDQEPLKQRVARYLELYHLQRLLIGENAAISNYDTETEKALDIIIHPGPNTTLMHRPLGSGSLVPIVRESQASQPSESDSQEQLFGILGFQSGLIRDSSKIEIKLFPELSILVSAETNGVGIPPIGIDLGAKDLYKPAFYEMSRIKTPRRIQFFLSKAEPLSANSVRTVQIIPSSIVNGAFKRNQKIAVSIDQIGRMTLNGESIPFPAEASKNSSDVWIKALMTVFMNIELSDSVFNPVDWVYPARPPKPTELARLLVALINKNGEAPETEVIEEINERFLCSVRINNTRRIAKKSSTFVLFDEESKSYKLTDKGRAYVSIYLGLGGQREFVRSAE